MKRLLLPALALAGCAKTTIFSGSLDTPAPIAVLDAATSPFTVPVGYVADTAGGRIRLLDLQRGRYLADDPYASFLRGASIGTGDSRLINALAAWAPDDTHAWVFAADARFEQLLRIPHVDGLDAQGFPHEPEPALVAAPAFVDADTSGDVTRVEGLALDPDLATSETWTFTFDGDVWQVEGTRSGTQAAAFFDVPWHARTGAITLLLRGSATAGDTLTFTVDRAIEEIDLDGVPFDVAVAPGGATLALTHALPDGGGVLRLSDPADPGLGAPVVLADGAAPTELAFTDDGATLLATDAALPALWEVDVESGVARRHELPWPAAHVAVLTGPLGRRAWLAPIGRAEVWVLDLDADVLLDLDPATAEVDGMHVLSTVQGLAPIPVAYDQPADVDTDPDGRSVAISLFNGSVVWMKEADGCLVPDAGGPRTAILSTASALQDYQAQYPISVPGTAYLETLQDGVHHVVVHPCAGVAPAETWEMRYDEIEQGWRVRGSISGLQSALAHEDQRYLSDRGQISVLVRAGTTPSQDGWRLVFNVLDGVMRATGDRNGDGNRDVNYDLPGRPVAFVQDLGGVSVPFVVVAAQTGDFVVKIDPRTSLTEAVWD